DNDLVGNGYTYIFSDAFIPELQGANLTISMHLRSSYYCWESDLISHPVEQRQTVSETLKGSFYITAGSSESGLQYDTLRADWIARGLQLSELIFYAVSAH